jgi:hypothetical protein
MTPLRVMTSGIFLPERHVDYRLTLALHGDQNAPKEKQLQKFFDVLLTR